jgi:hypothetical protein
MTGEQLESNIYIGPTYYMRLKHMVKDKINYRARGPNTMLTRQPVQGRANDGGLRIGEMERDGILGHGMSYFLNESFLVRGDEYYMAICNKTGSIAIYNESKNLFLSPYADGPIQFSTNPNGTQNIKNLSKFGRSFSILRVPYSLKLLIQELQVMNVQMRIITDENVDQLLNMSYSDNVYKLLDTKSNVELRVVTKEYNKTIRDIVQNETSNKYGKVTDKFAQAWAGRESPESEPVRQENGLPGPVGPKDELPEPVRPEDVSETIKNPYDTNSTNGSAELINTQNSPQYAPGSPAYNPNSPAYAPDSPAYNPNSPQFAVTSPAYNPNSPSSTQSSPYSPTKVPQYAPNSPSSTQSSPYSPTKVPQYAPNSPSSTQSSPYSPTKVPQYAPGSPYNPTFSAQASPQNPSSSSSSTSSPDSNKSVLDVESNKKDGDDKEEANSTASKESENKKIIQLPEESSSTSSSSSDSKKITL